MVSWSLTDGSNNSTRSVSVKYARIIVRWAWVGGKWMIVYIWIQISKKQKCRLLTNVNTEVNNVGFEKFFKRMHIS